MQYLVLFFRARSKLNGNELWEIDIMRFRHCKFVARHGVARVQSNLDSPAGQSRFITGADQFLVGKSDFG